MGHELGEPIHGELHSADAHLGVQVPIYKAGGIVAYVLQPWEWIEIHSIEIVTAAGGDVFLSVDAAANATPTPGTTVVRGTLAANSGLVQSIMHYTGVNAYLPFLFAPAGVVDCNFRGWIRGTTQIGRPNWREHYQTTSNPAGVNIGGGDARAPGVNALQTAPGSSTNSPATSSPAQPTVGPTLS